MQQANVRKPAWAHVLAGQRGYDFENTWQERLLADHPFPKRWTGAALSGVAPVRWFGARIFPAQA